MNSLLNCLEAANHATLACLAAFKNRNPKFLIFLNKLLLVVTRGIM